MDRKNHHLPGRIRQRACAALLLIAAGLAACGGVAEQPPSSLPAAPMAAAVVQASSAAASETLAQGVMTALRTPAPSPAALAFDAQPQDAEAVPGEAVQFSARARGHGPLRWQWYRDGEPIAGAQQDQHVLVPTLDDGGASFHVVVQDAQGRRESTPATLRMRSYE